MKPKMQSKLSVSTEPQASDPTMTKPFSSAKGPQAILAEALLLLYLGSSCNIGCKNIWYFCGVLLEPRSSCSEHGADVTDMKAPLEQPPGALCHQHLVKYKYLATRRFHSLAKQSPWEENYRTLYQNNDFNY